MRVLYKTDNEALNARYEYLFEELYKECQFLLEEGDCPAEGEIKDLNTYYLYLNKIKEKGTTNYELFRLPVNMDGGEGYFEIDANTRKITVPSNLVVVQGDQCAEIVYFRVSKFFDITDFGIFDNNNPDAYGKCIVQWSHQDNPEDEHYDEVFGFEIDSDYIYFGWILGGDVTSTPGIVKFSVRFYAVNDAGTYYDFSWSTLEAELKIHSSLDFNVLTFDKTQINDLSNLVQTRPLYSGIVSSSKGAKPIILQNLLEAYEITDTQAIGGTPVDSITIGVQAKTNDQNGKINYQWYTYYPESPEKAKIDGATESTYTITGPGQYQVMIGNTVNGGVTRYVASNIAEIPAAAEFTLTSGLPRYVYIADSADKATTLQVVTSNNENNVMSYQWQVKGNDANAEYANIEGATGNAYSVFGENLPEGLLRVIATASRNNSQFHRYSDTVDQYPVQLRKKPIAPVIAEIVLVEGIAGAADAVYECRLTNAEYYEKYDPSELRYEWNTSRGGLIKDANGLELSNSNTIAPFESPNLRGQSHTLGCTVYHVVWGDVVGMTESAQSVPSYLANVAVPAAQ